eukprot:CAMPEP_0184020240 /NCGR_PEP_ID=MMETSP0954-20121128/9233_1 /TAXON_ID=627963 /ORGANISM="Aplanochytrium sp, Strain PBS07" /LENGTH=147 /DNA_ID=CAMNT_0026302067 /DNA_START=324 /DNA_END=764 /DNA_ORIENTATION=+
MSNKLQKNRVKSVLVGDGAVGKTCLFAVWITGKFPTGYIPTVMDTYNVNINVSGEPVTLEVWDTAGQEDFSGVRQMSYEDADCFVICYSCDNRASLDNVWNFWVHEIKSTETPFILVGNKADLFDPNDPFHVPEAHAKAQAKKHGAW